MKSAKNALFITAIILISILPTSFTLTKTSANDDVFSCEKKVVKKKCRDVCGNVPVCTAACIRRTYHLKLKTGCIVSPHSRPIPDASDWALMDFYLADDDDGDKKKKSGGGDDKKDEGDKGGGGGGDNGGGGDSGGGGDGGGGGEGGAGDAPPDGGGDGGPEGEGGAKRRY